MAFSSHKPRAFALIATVLSLLVFSVTLSFALFQFSLGSATTAETVRDGAKALALAEGCADGVINEIRDDASFNEGSYVLPTGECEVTISQEGNDYTITVEANEGKSTRRVQVEFNRGVTSITILSWLEE